MYFTFNVHYPQLCSLFLSSYTSNLLIVLYNCWNMNIYICFLFLHNTNIHIEANCVGSLNHLIPILLASIVFVFLPRDCINGEHPRRSYGQHSQHQRQKWHQEVQQEEGQGRWVPASETERGTLRLAGHCSYQVRKSRYCRYVSTTLGKFMNKKGVWYQVIYNSC